MGDLTKDFNRYEFSCKGDTDAVRRSDSWPLSGQLVAELQRFRDIIGRKINIVIYSSNNEKFGEDYSASKNQLYRKRESGF